MVTALESKRELEFITLDAADTVDWFVRRTDGSFQSRRVQLLETLPQVASYYSDASAARAADFYQDARDAAGVTSRFAAEAVVLDRTVRIRRAVAWASDPLMSDDVDASVLRFQEVLRSEVARPYRDTIIENRRKDPAAVGWRRIARGDGCGFCRMLAAKGAVFRQATATFAAHNNCDCTAEPVFGKNDTGEPLTVGQYIGSKRTRTPAEKQKLREWVALYA